MLTHARLALLAAPLVVLVACSGDSSSDAGSGGASTASTGAGASSAGGGGAGAGGGGGSAPMGKCTEPVAPDPDIQQALPKVFLDTTYSKGSGETVSVPAGGDLQAAIDAAAPGDTLELAAGATYAGTIHLPKKDGDAWITIRTATPDASFPAPGTRVGPSDAPAMAKITAPAGLPALATDAGAHHYRLIGLELVPVDKVDVYVLAQIGSASEPSVDALAHDIVLDRMWIHGYPDHYLKRCIGLDAARAAVIDSYVSDCHAEGQDAQAIAGFNGPGPFKIVNNHLEGSGENVMFGGATPAIQDLVPSDIEIARNHFYKPLTWKADDPSYAGTHWSVKNLFELKNARRVLARCNVFENNWADAQVGFAIVLTPRGENGKAPWATVEDLTFVDNIVRHTASGVNTLGIDDGGPAQVAKRLLIQNNLFVDVNGPAWGGGAGWLYQILSGVEQEKIDHNTGFQSSSLVSADGAPSPGFVFTNNLSPHNSYGVKGSGQGVGQTTIDAYFPGSTFQKNVLVGGPEKSYPMGNFFPATMQDVGFVDYDAGDFRLKPDSPYAKAGTDGLDVGADVAAVLERTAGVAD